MHFMYYETDIPMNIDVIAAEGSREIPSYVSTIFMAIYIPGE